MKKIFMFLTTLFFLFILGGCGNSLDIPEIEGVYNRTHISDKGELLSKEDLLIKKIRKNKYSIKYTQFNVNKTIKNVELYQEFEIVEVKKIREKPPLDYRFKVSEFLEGTGYYEMKEEYTVNSISIEEFSFYPKTGAKKDSINILFLFRDSVGSLSHTGSFDIEKVN